MELVTATGHRRIPADREQRWPLASTTCRRIGAKLGGVKDLTAYWKEASPMSNRDFGCIALGRFLVVERYLESHQPSSTDPQRSPRADRTGRYADTPDSRSGVRAPARPQHG
jgi:hypothetical protein